MRIELKKSKDPTSDYLRDPDKYQKLRGLALEGRLIASQGDINDLESLCEIFTNHDPELRIAAIDFSNVHEQRGIRLPPTVSVDCVILVTDLYTSVGYRS